MHAVMAPFAKLSRSSAYVQSPFVGSQANVQPNNATKPRKSSVSSLRVLPLSFRSRRKEPEMPAVHVEHKDAGLLLLPIELQLQIVQHVSFSDLCSLRASHRTLNALIAGPDSAVSRYWVVSRLHHVHRLFPAPTEDLWAFLVAQMHRWNEARHLAEMIAYHIQYKTLLYVQRQRPNHVLSLSTLAPLVLPAVLPSKDTYHMTKKHVRSHPIARRITKRMTPLLFTFSHYLTSSQRTLLTSPPCISLASSHQPSSFWSTLESPDHYVLYTRDQLFQTHYTYLFLSWTLRTILNRPTWAGTIERTVRGWTTSPLDAGALTQVLVHGNLRAIKQLMRLKDYGERKRWAHSFLRGLDPELNPLGWKHAWQYLDMCSESPSSTSSSFGPTTTKAAASPSYPSPYPSPSSSSSFISISSIPSKTQAQALSAGPTKADANSLWTPGAATTLRTKYGIELEDNERHSNAATTIAFLCDMAGFDLFRESMPEGFGEDEDDDDDYYIFGGGYDDQDDYDNFEGADGSGDGDGESDQGQAQGLGEEERDVQDHILPDGNGQVGGGGQDGNYWDV